MSLQRTKRYDIRCPLGGGECERDIEWHPVPDKVQAVNQDGVPGKFPTSACVPGAE